jgi:hypothetical protein
MVGEGVQMTNLIFELMCETSWVGMLYAWPLVYKGQGYKHGIPNFG